MSESRLAFGKKIRRVRKDSGYGLREFARAIGVDYSNLSRIERGERPPPDLDVVIKMAKELEIDKNQLLLLAGVPEEVIENKETGEMNWIAGQVVGKSGNMTEIEAGKWKFHVVEQPASVNVMMGLRPADLTLFLSDEGFSDSSARNRLKGTIKDILERSNYYLAELDCESFTLKVAITDTSLKKMDLKKGVEVYATFKATAPVIKE
jgi:molybdopterin-binding protein